MRIVIHPEGDAVGAVAIKEILDDMDWDDDPVTVEIIND